MESNAWRVLRLLLLLRRRALLLLFWRGWQLAGVSSGLLARMAACLLVGWLGWLQAIKRCKSNILEPA
jgi:hypothetical protein